MNSSKKKQRIYFRLELICKDVRVYRNKLNIRQYELMWELIV